MNRLKLRAFGDADIKLMDSWLNKDYIKKWYEVPGLCSIDDWMREIRAYKSEFSWLTPFIALLDGKPVGFCQYYKCVDADEDWYGNVSLLGTYSIDYLIGEEEYLGKGIGKAMIALIIKEIFSLEDAERMIVQPDKENKASSNALLSNGFTLDKENELYILAK